MDSNNSPSIPYRIFHFAKTFFIDQLDIVEKYRIL